MKGSWAAALFAFTNVLSIISLPDKNSLFNANTTNVNPLVSGTDYVHSSLKNKQPTNSRKSSTKKYCSTSENVGNVMQKIMNSSKYNVHMIPSFEDGKPLQVKLALTVLVFRDMKEVDMTYTVDFFLRTRWHDKRLKNLLNCSLTMTMGKKHPAEIIWVPDTMIENSVTSYLHEVLTNNHKIDISPNGDIFWSTRVTAKAMCQMNLVKYPRDKQKCDIVLLSYAYTTDLLQYVWDEKNAVGVMDTTLSQFDVTSFSKDSYNMIYAAGQYSILKASFEFKRRLGYYLIQVYIPCIFLVVLAGLSFWVDAKATPARVALSLTTLLTIATIWAATNSNMPPVSYVKAVDIYFLTSFGFVLTTLLEYIVVLNYHLLKKSIKKRLSVCDHKPEEEKEKESFCRKHGILLSKRARSRGGMDNDELPSENCSNGRWDKTKMENDSKSWQGPTNQDHDSKIVTHVDKITKFVYPMAYIIFNIVYWYQLKE